MKKGGALDKILNTQLGQAYADSKIAGGQGSDILDFAVRQTLEQSSHPFVSRHKIYSELQPHINSGHTSKIISVLRSAGLVDELARQSEWLMSKRGQAFISTEIPRMIRSNTGIHVTPGVTHTSLKSSGAILSQIEANMSGIAGLDMDIKHLSGNESRFFTSRAESSAVHRFRVNSPALHTAFEFDFFMPSSSNIIAQSSDSSLKGWSKGESLFSVPQGYIMNPHMAAGGNYATTKASSFVDFQLQSLNNLTKRLGTLSATHKNPVILRIKVAEAVEAYQQELFKNQQYIGHASVVSNQDMFGTGFIGQAKRARAAFQSQVFGFSQLNADVSFGLGSHIPYELMQKAGGEFTLSSGQAGKQKAFFGKGFQLGDPRLMSAHYEPYKALSDYTPAHWKSGKSVRGNVAPSYVNLFETTGISTPGITRSALGAEKAPGIQAVTRFMNANKMQQMGSSLLQDGITLASPNAYKSGLLDVADKTVYKAKASGVAGTGDAIFGGTVGTLIEGGTITTPAGKTISIPGLNKSGGDFLKAMGMSSYDELNQAFPGGIPLGKEEFLGLESGSGRSLSSSANDFIDERIENIVRGSNNSEYQIITNRHVRSIHGVNGISNHQVKLVGDILTKQGDSYKSEIDMMTDREMAMYKMKDTKSGFLVRHSGALDDSSVRLLYQAGAVRNELDKNFPGLEANVKAGLAKKQQQELARRVILSHDDELLRSLSSGEMLKELESFTSLSSKQRRILSAKSHHTMQQRLAVVTDVLFSGLDETAKMSSLQIIFAPFTEWGQKHEINGLTEFYFKWDGSKDTKALAWSKKRTMHKQLSEALSSEVAGKILSSDAAFETLTRAAPRAYSEVLGAGGRATLEPRFFMAGMNDKAMHSSMKEITSRMTDYTPALKKLGASLEGNIPLSAGIDKSVPLSGLDRATVGLRDMVVELPTASLADDIQREIDALAPGKGFKFNSNLYVPGGSDITHMGTMITGAGTGKNKQLNQIYQDYFKTFDYLSGATPQDQAKAIAMKTVEFQKNLQGAIRDQITGIPGGQAHGMLRGPVQGSAYVPFGRMGMDITEQINVALGNDSLPKGFKPTSADKNFYNNFQQVIRDGESIGQQAFVSQKTARKMLADARGYAEKIGDAGLLDTINAQWKNLQSGGSEIGMLWRHPGIEPHSIGPTRIWLDRHSANTADEHYIRMAEERIKSSSIIAESAGRSTVHKVENELLTSILQQRKADFDGDHASFFLMSEQASKDELEALMRSGYNHRHSSRYHAMKTVFDDSISRHASKVSSSGSKISLKTGEALAHAGPKQVTPLISNTFNELNYIVSRSSLSDESKQGIHRFLGLAEQTSISSKHFTKQTEYNLELVRKVRDMRSQIVGTAAERKKAIDNLFSIYTTDGSGTLVDKITHNYSYMDHIDNTIHNATEEINIRKIQADIEFATSQNAARKESLQTMKFFTRNKSANIPINQTMDHVNQFISEISPVHAHAVGNMQVSGTHVSAASLTSVNTSIKSAAKSAAAKLPTQGIKGVAALAASSMLVAGSVGLVMGPTWKDANTGGQHMDSEYLFPDEVESRDVFLHSQGIATPQTGPLNMGHQSTLYMPPGSYNNASVGSRLAGILNALGDGSSGRIELSDQRSHLDSLTLSRIKHEII